MVLIVEVVQAFMWLLHMWHCLLLQVTGIESLAAVEGAVYIKYNSVSKVSWASTFPPDGRLQSLCFCIQSPRHLSGAQRQLSNSARLMISQRSAVVSANPSFDASGCG